MRRSTAITLLLITGIVAIVGVALLLDAGRSTSGDRFVGSDSAATSRIEADNPGYEPWFTPVFTPSSGEVESGLFAIQAALGGMVLGYCLGALRGRRRAEAVAAAQPAPTPGQP